MISVCLARAQITKRKKAGCIRIQQFWFHIFSDSLPPSDRYEVANGIRMPAGTPVRLWIADNKSRQNTYATTHDGTWPNPRQSIWFWRSRMYATA